MLRLAKLVQHEPIVTYEQFDLSREEEEAFDLAPVPAPAASTPAPAADTLVSGVMLIAAGGTIEGKVTTTSHVRIAGTLRGRLEADSVFIARGGSVDGEVEARTVHVEGQLRGSVTAAEIEILSGAVVEAELTYDDIDIARGARVTGLHRRREVPPPEPPVLALGSEGEAETIRLGVTDEAEQALQALAAVAHAAAAAAAELAGGSAVSLTELEEELRAAGAKI
ncbi:bactofilin family protein [Paracraurococcus lichenis]|uniref:Polymer-forming cytoskeletal protein n=1 Tax=Paracraurococcus lichenis TaxID=3064888 RepID=A0ABT9EE34_9PROT|nr:polymer-forming cytoskeletal protein [Paracraurococcus sp. LOR1-02]MDO9714233.1 polymer-forming cytoskeletal protein [Paracraurococcus sp. LOR1-02]